jgi:hypothetical protein
MREMSSRPLKTRRNSRNLRMRGLLKKRNKSKRKRPRRVKMEINSTILPKITVFNREEPK